MNKTQLLLSVPVLSCCFARTGVTTQNSKTRTPKNSDPTVSASKTQGTFTRQKRRNGSGRNKHRFQQNLPVYMRKFCKGTDKRMARSSENRVSFTRKNLSEPFHFLSEPFLFFRSCNRAFRPLRITKT